MTWQSALWGISLHQTISVKQRSTDEKRQVPLPPWQPHGTTFLFSLFVLRKQWNNSQVFCQMNSSRRFMDCGRYLAFLQFVGPEPKRSWCDICLTCRNTKPRGLLKPDWWKSLTSWRWFCRLTSMRSWREHQEDCRSSLTPLMVSLCLVTI